MEIKQCIMTNSRCYKEGGRIEPHIGIVVHSTGVNNPNIARYVQPSDDDPNKDAIIADIGKNRYSNDWNHTNVSAGVHCFIGKNLAGDVECYQVLPWNNVAWGVARGKMLPKGSPCYADSARKEVACTTTEDNLLPDAVFATLERSGVATWQYKGRSVYIEYRELGSYNYAPTPYFQFEICEDGLKDEAYFSKCMQTAQELCAYLCQTFNIPVERVVSHREAWLQGYGSGHSDPDHWQKLFGKDMNWFRSEVTKLMGTTTFKVGDKVKFKSTAMTWISGSTIPAWLKSWEPLYVRQIGSDDTKILVSTVPTGDVSGWARATDLELLEPAVDPTPAPQPEPEPEPTPAPTPAPVATEHYKKLAELYTAIASEFQAMADGK